MALNMALKMKANLLRRLPLGGMAPGSASLRSGFLQDGQQYLDVASGVSCYLVLAQMRSLARCAR